MDKDSAWSARISMVLFA